MKTIRIDDLRDFSVGALRKAGVSETDAAVIAEALVTTDLFGVFSHGTKNLLNYILKIRAGGLNARAVPVVEAAAALGALRLLKF